MQKQKIQKLAVPTAGLRVPFPGRSLKEPLAAEGERVVVDNYWNRREMHREVELRDVPAPVEATTSAEPAPETPAPDVAPEDTSAKRKKDTTR